MILKDNSNVLDSIKTLISSKDITKTFAYEHRRFNTTFTPNEILSGWNVYNVQEEFKRQKISFKKWRISTVNEEFKLCATYPKMFIVPIELDDQVLTKSANYRSRGRLPVLTWINSESGTPLVRCSQPNSRLGLNRSTEDEMLIDAYRRINECSKILTIIDCRPKVNAIGNSLKGKGYENMDYYKNCNIEFMNIENIHTITESFLKLSKIWTTGFSLTESSDWLKHISLILKASIKTVNLIQSRTPVIVHCSDGWDR
jgi:hypothetical protein